MSEKWIKVSENSKSEYYVSSEGRCKRVIKSTNEAVIDRGYCNNAIGYMQFAGDFVHRHVAKAFVPNPCNFEYVDHINSNRVDNRADNIRWVSRKANNSTDHSRQLRSKNSSATQHKDQIIKATRDGVTKLFKSGYACAQDLGCSHVLVYNALNKRLSAKRAKGWNLEWISIPQE